MHNGGGIAQHREYLMQLLAFTTMSELFNFLDSAPVTTSFQEFVDDCLSHSTENSEDHEYDAMISCITSRASLYCTPQPDKHSWGTNDYAARFVLRAYEQALGAQVSGKPHSCWSGLCDSDLSSVTRILLEVLRYLVSEWSLPTPAFSRHQVAGENLRKILGFDTMEQLTDFVGSPVVQNPWSEFYFDQLHGLPSYVPPTHDEVMQALSVRQLFGLVTDNYARDNPDKTYWQSRHHCARFIVRVLNASRTLEMEWTGLHAIERATAMADSMRCYASWSIPS
jgi:hypothetical protein